MFTVFTLEPQCYTVAPTCCARDGQILGRRRMASLCAILDVGSGALDFLSALGRRCDSQWHCT